MNRHEDVESAIEKLCDGMVLGRSQHYKNLLRYLFEQAYGESCKPVTEASIASAVFQKRTYDKNFDSYVRSYVSNLRRKLDTYYNGAGKKEPIQLMIPVGSYQLLERQPPLKAPSDASTCHINMEGSVLEEQTNALLRNFCVAGFLRVFVAIVVVAFLVAYVLYEIVARQSKESMPAIWKTFSVSPRPTLIVVGDLYMFGEEVTQGRWRLIRDTRVNSDSDLSQYNVAEGNRRPVRRSVVTRESLMPLAQFSRWLGGSHRFQIKLCSEVVSEDFINNNIIFLGTYLSLQPYLNNLLQTADFRVEESRNDRRVEIASPPHSLRFFGLTQKRHQDYGLFAWLEGPVKNRIMIVSGFADASIALVTDLMTKASSHHIITDSLKGNQLSFSHSFRMVFDVQSHGVSPLGHSLKDIRGIDMKDVWAAQPTLGQERVVNDSSSLKKQ